MTADEFTKALDKEKFIEFHEMIGMTDSIMTAEWDTDDSTGCFLILYSKTMKIFKNKNTQKREEKRQESKHASMRKTLYKRYLMLNLAEIEQEYTANFVCRFLKISWVILSENVRI